MCAACLEVSIDAGKIVRHCFCRHRDDDLKTGKISALVATRTFNRQSRDDQISRVIGKNVQYELTQRSNIFLVVQRNRLNHGVKRVR